MIIADKIIKLRKKNGWSQEELADKMNVSRQAVSKWESAQTVPDLTKILQLSNLFGVTTDYLLKDEIENEEFTDNSNDSLVKRLSMEDANIYLDERKRASWQIALATFLCIVSPITLIIPLFIPMETKTSVSFSLSCVSMHLSFSFPLWTSRISFPRSSYSSASASIFFSLKRSASKRPA